MDFGCKAQETENLGDAGPGYALPPGDLGLIANLAGVELATPLDGLAEEFGHSGSFAWPRSLWLASVRGNGPHDPVSRHTAFQGPDVAILEGPPGPQSDLDLLLQEAGSPAVLALSGRMDDLK